MPSLHLDKEVKRMAKRDKKDYIESLAEKADDVVYYREETQG